MAQYCVYCYNGIHKTYYRKSKDFILTKDYHKCAGCGRQRRLVEMQLFPHGNPMKNSYPYNVYVSSSIDFFIGLYYLLLNIVVRSYRLIKKLYKKLTQKTSPTSHS